MIDLRQGRVVHARLGDRANYQPIESRLAAGSDPLVIARALLHHCASRRLYVADLDALSGGPPQTGVLQALARALPQVEWWLDAAFTDAPAARALCQRLDAALVPVFGSESLASREALQRCAQLPRAVLSLDRRGAQRLDPAGCWDMPQLWPRDVIVMALERVGSGAGPDLDALAQVQHRAPGARVYGAGGIRHADDLRRAQAAGAAGWLVASALHDGRLAPAHALAGDTP